MNTHLVGIALKFKIHNLKIKQSKAQERLHCARKQWAPIQSLESSLFQFCCCRSGICPKLVVRGGGEEQEGSPILFQLGGEKETCRIV